jgi:signal transduction histidine kinase
MDSSGCDAVEVRLSHGELHYRWEATRRPGTTTRFEPVRWTRGEDGTLIPALHENSDLEWLCRAVACQQVDAAHTFFTENGSFWTGDAWERVPPGVGTGREANAKSLCVGGHYRSLVIIRFVVDEATIGLLHMKSERPNYFTREEIEFYEAAAQTLGLAVADWQAQYALRERVKELTCLYGVAQVTQEGGGALDDTLRRIVMLLPPAWQYPDIAAARIVLDGRAYESHGFRPGHRQQSAEIIVSGRRRGVVEVMYGEDRPEFTGGAFLPEEDKLIDAVAHEVSLIVEHREAEHERANLQQQLIHADRLATIGQLAAGVAHELNEPLGSILGFAQLAKKCPGLPQSAAQDIQKIVTSSLYAREVIKKLMVFGRQVPARKVRLSLNEVVEEGLYFLEARCAKGGIRVVRDLAPDIPDINADPAQLRQVLVNLVVNAVQAMPDGGTLTVGTQASGSAVSLVVQDTGIGMTEEVAAKIFVPFFTTKGVSEGTGLGLPVVHGIVSSHGGSINVESRPGQGARFEIRLPIAECEAAQEIDPDGAHD